MALAGTRSPRVHAADVPAVSVSQLTVVVADPGELFRSSLVRCVQSHPRLKLLASVGGGHAALEAIRRQRPDVATLEARMPGLDGEQVLAQLRAEGAGTRVLLLSAHIDGALVARALAAGAAGCLAKDDSKLEVTEAIIGAVERRTVISALLQPLVAAHLHAIASAPPQVRLSPRELEVLELASHGKKIEEIALELHISRETVNTFLLRASAKLGVKGKTHAVATALRAGLLH